MILRPSSPRRLRWGRAPEFRPRACRQSKRGGRSSPPSHFGPKLQLPHAHAPCTTWYVGFLTLFCIASTFFLTSALAVPSSCLKGALDHLESRHCTHRQWWVPWTPLPSLLALLL
eukprot:scaffold5855_cov117-Isochrysis_galbana.AAC.6